MSKKKNQQLPEENLPQENLPEENLEETPDTAAEQTESPEGETAEAETPDTAAPKDTKAKKSKQKRQPTSKEEQERALNRVKRLKKLKYGSLATGITVIFVAIVVFANIVCSMLDSRYNWNIDLTSSGLYQIDEQTIAYLNQLNTDVEIAVMAKESYFLENSNLKVVAETLNRFKAESNGHISVEYIDMTANPQAVQKYSDYYSGEFSSGDIVLKSGELVRVAAFDDIIRYEQSVDYTTYSYVTKVTFTGEQTLVAAIMGVTDLNPMKAAMIDTMNGSPIYYEYDNANFVSIQGLLEKNNYEVVSVDIATDAISPEEYDLIVLCSPFNDLSEAQITKLNDYLSNGGQYGKQMIYFASPFQQNIPNLTDFLSVWGFSIGNALIYDGNDATAQYVSTALGARNSIPTVKRGDSSLNTGIAESKLPTVAPLCLPITRLFDQNSGRVTEELLTTVDTAYLFPMDAESDSFDISSAETGSFCVAAVGRQSFTVNNETLSSRVAVFSSAWLLDYYVASSASYDNADYFISLVNQMTGKENVITVAEKSLDTASITVTEAQAKAIRTVTVFVIPLAVALVGVLVYVRRRNR